MKNREVFTLVAIIAVFLVIGGVLIATRSLPEDHAKNFNIFSAGNVSLQSTVKVIKEPTPGDNTFIYAINDVSEEAYNVAQIDPRVKEILDGIRGEAAVTIAAVQPTVLTDAGGNLIHSSGGQILITANWQLVGGRPYSAAASFGDLESKQGVSHQQIWSVIVDLDRRAVVSIAKEPERVAQETLKLNHVYSDMNIFLPDAAKISPGTTIRWSNESNIPHNVVGIYNATSGPVAVDSGFIQQNRNWQYVFSDAGTFEYLCTIHAEEGMKGTIIVE